GIEFEGDYRGSHFGKSLGQAAAWLDRGLQPASRESDDPDHRCGLEPAGLGSLTGSPASARLAET
ncbi:MAG: hypothetical protein ACK56I_36495, partial [bacterium]